MADSGRVLVSSPRRLSLTREKASVSFLLDEKKDEGATLKEQDHGKRQGAKPVEVYAFVGSISSIVAFAIFVIWSYFPESWLHSVGITYYPDKYWAVALPGFFMVTVAFAMFTYLSLNHMATPPPESLNTLFDDNSRQPVTFSSSGEQPIHPIADMPLIQVNRAMFG